jgi:hypothetical protein
MQDGKVRGGIEEDGSTIEEVALLVIVELMTVLDVVVELAIEEIVLETIVLEEVVLETVLEVVDTEHTDTD